jgi:transcriptional regulator with XRE-family HTH domain
MPRIIRLLSYVPISIDTSTLPGKLKQYRFLHGLSQEKFAKFAGVNETTVRDWENGLHKPLPKTLKRLKDLMNSFKASYPCRQV